ncbi:MAG: sugar ABC transporter ATP-binding protein [Chloroflexota bacterium]|nr:sugar ABC transporter ATP-binding protein [Chloroflexota bacterium]
MTPLLSIRRASKHYGGTAALMDATLDLYSGEIQALMGENGAGKSTLIKLLAGVTQPDSMEVRLHDQPVPLRTPQDAYALGLRFIHQELTVVPQLSVAENIFIGQPYPRRLGTLVDWRRLNDGARAALAHLGIAHIDPRVPMARLATGDRMLVKIASAFADNRARIYVLDEPTAALTGAEANRLFAVLNTLSAQGAAMLYVSHRLDEIFRICQRVTVMRDGRVVASEMTDALTPERVIELMTGRAMEQAYPGRIVGTSPASSAARKDETGTGQERTGPALSLLAVNRLATRHVRDVTFTLAAGEILGVAGLQGAGRTELLRALSGVDRLIDGSVVLSFQVSSISEQRSKEYRSDHEAQTASKLEIRTENWKQRTYDVTAAWQRGIAYVPEERRAQGLMLSRSIRDNVSLPHLGMLSWRGAFLRRRHEERLASQVGEGVRLKAHGMRQRVRELSGGNQQKVLFARALARNPRLLLLDEPARGVDVGAKYDIYTLVRQASAGGTGVIMASSDLGELLGLCDRILIMRARRMVTIVEAQGLEQAQLLSLCYGDAHAVS